MDPAVALMRSKERTDRLKLWFDTNTTIDHNTAMESLRAFMGGAYAGTWDLQSIRDTIQYAYQVIMPVQDQINVCIPRWVHLMGPGHRIDSLRPIVNETGILAPMGQVPLEDCFFIVTASETQLKYLLTKLATACTVRARVMNQLSQDIQAREQMEIAGFRRAQAETQLRTQHGHTQRQPGHLPGQLRQLVQQAPMQQQTPMQQQISSVREQAQGLGQMSATEMDAELGNQDGAAGVLENRTEEDGAAGDGGADKIMKEE